VTTMLDAGRRPPRRTGCRPPRVPTHHPPNVFLCRDAIATHRHCDPRPQVSGRAQPSWWASRSASLPLRRV